MEYGELVHWISLIKKQENRAKKKRDVQKGADFDQIHEKVREIKGDQKFGDDSNNATDSEAEGEPFIDEFGNVIDDHESQDAIAAKAKELLSSPK